MGRGASRSESLSRSVLVTGAFAMFAMFAGTSSGFAGAARLAQNIPQTAPNNPSDSAPPEKPAPPARDQQACGQPGATMQPKGPNEKGATVGRAPSKENLSDTLSRSGGVLCPPAGVDPDIRAPATGGGGSMPVIPPPGSPGGDPTVRPK